MLTVFSIFPHHVHIYQKVSTVSTEVLQSIVRV